jgi:hypothetical protein
MANTTLLHAISQSPLQGYGIQITQTGRQIVRNQHDRHLALERIDRLAKRIGRFFVQVDRSARVGPR